LREWEIVHTAKEGIGSCYPLVWQPRRVETSPGRAITLPFNQFAFAESVIDDKDQWLKFFATREILIEGHNLRRIEIAMQKRELSFVAKLSTNYHPLVNQGQPVILKIVVTEAQPPNKKS
jgi:hypothetical protein